ncbi:MAG TPA: TonB-dependent siderophore receptor [Caulobacteraceae bacterium]|jgi:iron complex outermembrane receptor protein|nr:TonB-dependent siderophore receptor [Caulobacteraceae bacterium]
MSFDQIRKRVLLASTALAVAGAGSAAWAQERASGTLDEVVVTGGREVALDVPTVTGSRLGLNLRETPAIVDVLTQDRFLERGLRTSNEALNTAPGVTAVDTGGGPGTMSMRGFTGGSVSVNYDGVHQPSTMVTRNYDSFAFDRIEILKGPSSVLYGEGALGGAVNYVPKKPEFGSRAFQGLAQYGSRNTFRGAADVNLPLNDKVGLRGVFSYAGGDGYIDRTWNRTLTANLGLTYKPADNLTVFLAAEYFWNNNGPTYWGTPLVAASVARDAGDQVTTANGFVLDKALQRTNFQYDNGLVRSDNLWLRSQIDWKINGTWRFRNDLSYNNGDRLWDDAESYAYNAATRLVNRQPIYIRNLLDFWNERAMLSSDSNISGHRNRFMVGAEHSQNDHTSIRRFGANTPVNPYALVGGPFPAFTAANFPGAGNFVDAGSRIVTNAVFAENALNLTDKWLLVGGARYEEMKLDRTIKDYNLNTNTAFATTYKPFSFRIGTVYDVAAKTQLYAQYNQASAPVGTLVLLSAANSAFKLTRGRAAEVGLKSSFWNDRIEMTLAGYWIRQTDIITRDPINLNLSVQGGTQSSRGIELSGSAALTRQLRVDLNYAVVNARFDKLLEAGGLNRAGNSPTNVPAQVLNLFASYQLMGAPVKLTAGLRRSNHIFGDNANTVRIAGNTVFDASVSYRLGFGEIVLRGRNLGDALYAEWGGAAAVYLAAPRSIDLTFQTRF